MSLRHLNGDYLGEQDILTGFVPDGELDVVLAELSSEMMQAGYEELLAANGFVPIVNDALVVLNADLGIVVSLGVVAQEAPVRNSDDECPWQPGVLVSMRFEQADVEEARARYSGSSLTQGVAQATIGGLRHAAEGECFVHSNSYTFGSTSVDPIGLHFEVSDSGTVGSASVNVEGKAVFNLDPAESSDSEPEFRVSESGFSVDGAFVDGFGDLGVAVGRVVVTCDRT